MPMPILSLLLTLPLAGAVLILAAPRRREVARALALGTSLADLAVGVGLWFRFDPNQAGYQLLESYRWIPNLGISYLVAVDGLSLFLVLLTTLLVPLSVLASWDSIKDKTRAYYASLLLLESAMLGVFLALDVFLFYVFWEAMLIPMYLLIGVWGGERRIYAALKFILFTLAGSVLMLVAILVCYEAVFRQTGIASFDLRDWQNLILTPPAERWLFLAFFAAFAVKVPLFPLHTWLPDAHVEAPTAGSVLLAGVLLKMGTYGLVRFAVPLFPNAAVAFAPAVMVLAVIGIIYGALVAMVQPDVKKLVAYSSVSHLGFVVLGIFSFRVSGLEGAVLQMVNHGLSTGALFLLVGMLYDRRHTRLIEEFGGLKRVMPRYAGFFLVVLLSSIGLPGLNGFVGEFLILLGTFEASWRFAALAALGVILAAVYMLRMYQRVMLGEVERESNRGLSDLGARELAILVPTVLLIVWIGVAPGSFLRPIAASVELFVSQVPVATASGD
jgi:NADH-quinone oxidoreductase subunit M